MNSLHVLKTEYVQHFDDDTRSELKHVRGLVEVNKCVCALGSIKLFLYNTRNIL